RRHAREGGHPAAVAKKHWTPACAGATAVYRQVMQPQPTTLRLRWTLHVRPMQVAIVTAHPDFLMLAEAAHHNLVMPVRAAHPNLVMPVRAAHPNVVMPA